MQPDPAWTWRRTGRNTHTVARTANAADHAIAQRLADLYNHLAQKQGRLPADFEAAIFSDLEGLYDH